MSERSPKTGSESNATDLIRRKLGQSLNNLLDLGRRNPLVSTRFSVRSNAFIRVVDELPEILFERITSGNSMFFVALPDLNEDPPDEESETFLRALAVARRGDEQYVQESEAADAQAEDEPEVSHQIERSLRDRVRASLGLPARESTRNDLVSHAQLHGISPSYELPRRDADHPDGRHQDNEIQTLLLPADLNRKLAGLSRKCKEWSEETGIGVLNAAFGFLEWEASPGSDPVLSPLVLVPAIISRSREQGIVRYEVESEGDAPEVNGVLTEKLRREFGIELPAFTGQSIERYFDEVANVKAPEHLKWKVRRQVCYGVFPSPNMALHRDIETNLEHYVENDILADMFGGTTTTIASPRALDYEVDDPEIETKVPFTILDADSSQFAVMVDIANGKSLAVEGPPGTGKSQTIVNVIAAALTSGKKVLFVASKAAALNVVKARLDAVGLGEFCLALRADRSSRKELAQSLKDRVFMDEPEPSPEFARKRKQYREARDEMSKYLNLLASKFGDTELTVHELLGANIKAMELLERKPTRLTRENNLNRVTSWSPSRRDNVLRLANLLEENWKRTRDESTRWKGHQPMYLDRFGINDRCRSARQIAAAYRAFESNIQRVCELSVERPFTLQNLKELRELFSTLPELHGTDAEMVGRVCEPDSSGQFKLADAFNEFLDSCTAYQNQIESLRLDVAEPEADEWIDRIKQLRSHYDRFPLSNLSESSVDEQLQEQRELIATRQQVADEVEDFLDICDEARELAVDDVQHTRELVESHSDVLALRNEFNCAQNNLPAFDGFLIDAYELRALHDEILTFAYLPDEIGVSEMRAQAATLRGGNSFFTRWFSGSFKAAKKHYLSISKRMDFSPEQAAADMLAVADCLRQMNEFKDDRRGMTLFGLQFNGFDSDLDQFKSLYDFVMEVTESYSERRLWPLRRLLLEGDQSELDLIPNTTGLVWEPTLGEFLRDVHETKTAQSALAEFEQSRGSIVTLSRHFLDPKSVDRAKFEDVYNRFDHVFALREKEAVSSKKIRELVGDRYQGLATNRSAFSTAEAAVKEVLARPHLSDVASRAVADGMLTRISEELNEARKNVDSAEASLAELDETTGISADEFKVRAGINEDATIGNFSKFFEALADDERGIDAWSAFAMARKDVDDEGFGWVTDALIENGESLEDFAEILENVVMLALMRRVTAEHGEAIARFRGTELDELRGRIAKLDQEVIDLARHHARTKILGEADPPVGNGKGPRSTWTEMTLINNEANKKTRHLPVRDMIERAGESLLQLKPCWMMPPLAVAQYVDTNTLDFDLCIIDEASQMRPEDAVGSLSRANQAMVVGDTNQLGPTNFFRSFSEDEDVPEDERIEDESILELANNTFRPARRLRWHYRSRDPSLIAFSNRYVYDNDLVVFPRAEDQNDAMGVSLVKVDGIYQSGENPIEGKAMVDAAIRFMDDTPERSLGLVTLNQRQRDLILDEIEMAIGTHPHAQEYVDRWEAKDDGLEAFFVKNLENVQGDERDTIFVGTVYGPAAPDAPVMQRFGPVSGISGKRRLNVLFSRAKEQIVTFSSMTAADIRDDESNPGRTMLKNWLEYAATGFLAADEVTGKPPDSEFEIFVIEQIEALGAIAIPQVGVSGYYIDIGVKHPHWPHGYILAVECDGASYHSSRSARDRDRLRQQVLEGLGWHFHRIWSTDWFRDPSREVEKLKKRIESRLEELLRNPVGDSIS